MIRLLASELVLNTKWEKVLERKLHKYLNEFYFDTERKLLLLLILNKNNSKRAYALFDYDCFELLKPYFYKMHNQGAGKYSLICYEKENHIMKFFYNGDKKVFFKSPPEFLDNGMFFDYRRGSLTFDFKETDTYQKNIKKMKENARNTLVQFHGENLKKE